SPRIVWRLYPDPATTLTWTSPALPVNAHMHSPLPGLPYPTVSTAAWRSHRLRPRVSSRDERRSNDPCADPQEPATAPVALCHCRLHSCHGIRSNYAERLLAHAPGSLPRSFP